MVDLHEDNSEALYGLNIPSSSSWTTQNSTSTEDDNNTSAGVCSENMDDFNLDNTEKIFHEKDFYRDNPETLYIAPDCGLRIKLRQNEDSKEFGCEYKVLNVHDFPLLNTYPKQEEIKGWLSPRRAVTLPEEEREEAGIPQEAKSFTYLYPPRGLAEYIDWKKKISSKTSNKSALRYIATFGGYVYFDEKAKVICVNAISFIESKYKLNFEGPFEASKSSYRKMSGLNLYQDLYIDCFREASFIGSAWVDPGEDKFIDTEVEGQSLIKNKHGGFLYFRHDRTAVIFLVEFEYDLATPSRHRTGSLIIDAFRLCKYELRLQNSSSVTCPSFEEETDLHIAAKDGSEEHFHHMHYKLTNDMNLLQKQDSFGWTPLHYACAYHSQDYEFIKTIIKYCPGAVKIANKNNLYPIHLACLHNPSVKVIELLLIYDPDKETLKMRSEHHEFLPLHFACSNRNTSIEVIRSLVLAYSRAVSKEGKIGCTPLRIAVAETHSHEVIELLLRYSPVLSSTAEAEGGKTNPILLKKVNGMLPLHLACLKGCPADVVSLLLEADVENKSFYSVVEKCAEYDFENSTIFHIALAHSPIDVIDLLLSKEVMDRCTFAQRDTQNNLLSTPQKRRDGTYPIHVACKRKDLGIEIIRNLLRLEKESIFYEDSKKNRPLHHICTNKDVDEKLVELLLDAEKDCLKAVKSIQTLDKEKHKKSTRILNKKNETPLHTPLHVAVKAEASGAHVLLGPDHIYLEGMDDQARDKLLKLLLSSQNMQKEMVATLAQRRYFAFIMLELVANILATAIYLTASPRPILENAPVKIYELVILAVCVLIFIVREIIQWKVVRSYSYATDLWNWIDWSSIGSTTASIIHMIHLRMNEDVIPLRFLFGLSGVLLILQFIFIVRTTFLPFARFVAGLLAITLSLIPFLVVSVMLLSAFTYSYLISGQRAEECPNFNSCFLWTLEGFFFGMESFNVTPGLDIAFGVVAVVVL